MASSNKKIISIEAISTPTAILNEYPLSSDDAEFVQSSRAIISQILHGKDKRLVVVSGPCSIHDPGAALEFAKGMCEIREKLPNIFWVMRVYFEKPRTTVGWKGLIYDPLLDDSCNIELGIKTARKLMVELTKMRVPIGCEFLDLITHSTLLIVCLGVQLVPARRSLNSIGNFRVACRCLSDSRT
jgi:3-deoxy-7-phosphoheptulonate synthase